MLSAIKIDEAHESLRKALYLLRKECQGRKWETPGQRDKLENIIDIIEHASTMMARLQVNVFGFEFWKAIEDEAKALQEEEQRKKDPAKVTYGDETSVDKDMADIRAWLTKYPDGAVIVNGSNGCKLVAKLVNGGLEFSPLERQ